MVAIVGLVMPLLLLVAGCATQADIQTLAREQRQIRARLADTRASLEAMEREVARTRGRIEESRFQRRDRRDPLVARLDRLEERLAALERSTLPTLGDATEYPPDPSAAPAPPDAEGAPDAVGRELARELPEHYRDGLTAMREGAPDRAITAFREFLRVDPDSSLAPNAHYWIGEAYYKLGDYQQAVLNYNRVRQKHPRSEHAAAAVLKIGVAFLEMGNRNDARLFFEKVVSDYPATREAEQAREQLRRLGA